MSKKILTVILALCFALSSTTAFADTKDEVTASMSQYPVINENMNISLPDGWYFNTPNEVDQDFLEVTDNKERKLKKYLSKNGIQYNLVSKDLKEEINVVTQHTSQTKAMFDFNLIDEEILKDRAQTLIGLGTQEEDDIKTTYTSYEIKKINKCVFTVFTGKVEAEIEDKDEDKVEIQKTDFIQYTTTINGYGITISYRGNEDADLEQGSILIEQVVNSFDVIEVIETELKKEVYKQMLTPIAIAGGFILITATLIIRHVIKNRKQKK